MTFTPPAGSCPFPVIMHAELPIGDLDTGRAVHDDRSDARIRAGDAAATDRIPLERHIAPVDDHGFVAGARVTKTISGFRSSPKASAQAIAAPPAQSTFTVLVGWAARTTEPAANDETHGRKDPLEPVRYLHRCLLHGVVAAQ